MKPRDISDMPSLASASRTPEVASQVVTWLAVPVLVYFALSGVLRVSAATNSAGEMNQMQLTSGDSSVLGHAIAIMCIGGSAVFVASRLKSIFSIARRHTVFVLLALLACISAIWSQDPKQSLMYGTFMVLNIGFAFYFSSRFTPRHQMLTLYIVGWILTSVSLLAVFLFPGYGIDHRVDDGAWIGVYGHKNACSIIESAFVATAIYQKASGYLSAVLRVSFICLAVLLIAMSKSRTGWISALSMIIVILLLAALKRFSQKDRVVVSLLIAGGVTLCVAAVASNYALLMQFIGKDATLTGRTDIWALVVASAMKRPLLGYGYQAFWGMGLRGESATISLTYGWIPGHAHDGLLNVWITLGAVGVGLVLITILQAIRDAIRALRRNPDSEVLWYVSLLVLTLVSNIAEVIYMSPNNLIWMLFVVTCVCLHQWVRDASRRKRELI
jgi:exopolysaccharide production protein ExoQ